MIYCKEITAAGCFVRIWNIQRSAAWFQSLENHVEDAWIDPVPQLRHCIGNIINGVVFGRTYNIDDPEWIYLQHLLDEGIKKVAVAGPLNFLPILRLEFTELIVNSLG